MLRYLPKTIKLKTIDSYAKDLLELFIAPDCDRGSRHPHVAIAVPEGAGEVVRCEIDGLGRIKNTTRSEWAGNI
ncbi:hypothetical protein ACV229_15540 [Burkholderia sp. MR1-5-21]